MRATRQAKLGRRFFSWLTALILGLVAVTGGPPDVAAQSLDELVEDAQGFEQRVRRLEDKYLKPALLESRYKLETRFNDARVAYMMEEYDRASLLFADVVRDREFDSFGSRRAALYLMGDSLFQRRNFLSAKKYFQRVVDQGPGDYYQDAVVRLLEIAAKTGDYKGVDDLYERFDSKREASAAVNYVRGKTLFDQEKYEQAVPFFNRAAEDKEWEHRARYFKGVCLAGAGNYDESRNIFRSLVDTLDKSNSRQRNLLHLSWLALGRVAYEQGKFSEAIDLYQRLPRSSPHFDRSLYELTWVLVSQEEYKKASRNADVFLYLSNPDPTFVPEIKLLKADLELRLEQYDRATASYEEVVDQFKPVRERVNRFFSDKDDVGAFFVKLVDEEIAGNDPNYLPERVQKWIDQSEEMERVTQTVRDVSSLERDIRESRQALDEIEARLESGSSIQSFPDLAEGMTLAIAAESQLIELRKQLLDEEYAIVSDEMSGGEKETWDEMRKELEDYQRKYAKVPKTADEVKDRERKVQERFEKLRDKLDSVSYAISGQKQELRSIDEYIREEYDGTLPEGKKREVEALRKEVEHNIAQLEKRAEKLRHKISVTRQKTGVGDEVTQRERQLRRQYRQKMTEHRQFLADLHSRVGPDERSQLRRIQEARDALPAAYARLQGFFDKMRDIVDEKVQELKQTIAQEREVLDERQAGLQQLRNRSRDSAAKVAYQNFVEVKRKFDEIVLRGDVGLIDVAWKEKEGMTDEINQLREDRRSELKALQESFNEVR